MAKRAGAGIGTLYRHFPNRQALLEAVYRDQVNMNCVHGRELLATKPPAEALQQWLYSLLMLNLTTRGLKEAMMAGEVSPQTSECKAQMHGIGGELLARARGRNGAPRYRDHRPASPDAQHCADGRAGPRGSHARQRFFEVMVAGLKG